MRLEEASPRHVTVLLLCEECEETRVSYATYQCSSYERVAHLCDEHAIKFFKPYLYMIDYDMSGYYPDHSDVEIRRIVKKECTSVQGEVVLYDTPRKIKRAAEKVEQGLCPVPRCRNLLRGTGEYSCIVEQHMRYTPIYRDRVLGEDVSDTFAAYDHRVPMTMPSGRVMMVRD